MPNPDQPHSHSLLWNVPNLLSLARVPLGVVVFICITHHLWLLALVTFAIACVTDFLDGWWARKYGPLTLIGRNLDPLTDKFLVCGTFIYLILEPSAGIDPWMVVVVVGRELLVTGIRGMVESTGQKFGADWFGKLKMGLQCAVLIGVFLILWWQAADFAPVALDVLKPVEFALLWLMLFATVGSGVQYMVKAARMLRTAA